MGERPKPNDLQQQCPKATNSAQQRPHRFSMHACLKIRRVRMGKSGQRMHFAVDSVMNCSRGADGGGTDSSSTPDPPR